MAKAKAIVKRRKVVINTRKITKTMELVSTAKFKQSFNRIASAMPYRQTLQGMMRDLASAGGEIDHPLLRRRDPARHVTLLLLTSNRGLAGGFNSNLIKTARSWIAEQREAGAEVALHVVGKKGLAYFRYVGEALAGGHTQFGDRPAFADVEVLAEQFMEAYAEERTDRVAVVYQKYLSAGVQRPWTQVLLPLETATAESEAAARTAGPHAVVDYIYSPDAESLLRQLLPAYFKTSLYHAFLENAVGEQRARMVAMKNATDNAETMIKTLTRMYNRARQSQITNEISEIMGGVEALK
jgi:F-type H+-transporting ATPase subunit gamma